MSRTIQVSISVGTCLGAFLLNTPAWADTVEPSAGFKLMTGGSLWTTPGDRPNNYDGLGFAGNGGGFSYGAGLYFEVRFLKFVGLELDILYDKAVLQRNVTHSHNQLTAKTRERIDINSWRFPILVKGNIPTPFGRLFALVGPEFVRSSSANPSLEVIDGNATLLVDLRAEKANYTMLTGGVGLAIELPKLEIPIELRASKNLGQEDAWLERVDADQANNRFVVDAQTSWDFRLSAGLGYRF